MTIVKPLRLGLLARAHRQPPKVYYFVAAVGYFDLLDPTDFGLETEMWPTITPAIGGDMLDTCMPKPAGEMLVAGDACAPAGETVRQCVVDIQLGAIKKRLAVFGDREWMHGDGGPVFTRPAAFSRMPISWENAFGGAGVDVNPGGKGAGAEAALREGRQALLPNVEDPARLILGIGDKPAPIGVRPMAIDHPARMKHAGTVDDSYLREQFPGHPLNFDWAFYHSAAPDQRAAGYLRGDEPIRITGMHPDHPVIASRLPAMRARAFLNLDKGEGETEFREVTLRCETVWLFPTLLKGVVIYRGGCEIGDIDGLDVKDTMLVYERMAEEPRSIEHYLSALKERTDPETAALKFFDEKPLRPELTADQVAEREEEVAVAETEEERKREKRAELAIVGAFRAAGLPAPPSIAIPKPPPLPVKIPVVTPQALARMEVDMVGILKATKDIQAYATGQLNAAKAQALGETASWLRQVQQQTKGLIPAKKAAKLASAAKSVAGAMAKLAPPGMTLPDGSAAPDATAMDEGTVAMAGGIPAGEDVLAALAEGIPPEQMAELDAAIAALDAEDTDDGDIETEKRLARARALGLPEGALLAPARDQLDQLSSDGLAQRLAGAPEGMRMPDLAAALSAPPTPEPAEAPAGLDDADAFLASLGISVVNAPPPPGGSADAKAAMAKAADAVKQVTEASPLAAHAMAAGAQADPVPMDAALDQARTSLDAAQAKVDEGLGKVRLVSPQAIFPLNDMAEAVSVDLGALILDLRGRGESLAGRELAGASLAGADLSGLDLSGVKLEKADLRGAKLTASNLYEAALTGANLDGADFTGAVLTGANLSSVSARETVFAKADLRDARMMMADLSGADLSGCRLAMTQVLNATLTGARFAGAELDRLMFIQSEMTGIVLDGARAKSCIFIEIDLEGLSARGAALNKCVMVSVSAEHADFTGADLSDSALIGGVKLNGGLFRDLVAPRSGWRQASLIGADFTAARLDEADLGEVDLTDARLPRASFRRANLSAATLERADLAAANLFEAQVRRVNLVQASLRRANLFSANLDEANLAFCDITGANLNRTLFARPGRVA
ncbi:MAG: DUF2169 domain-containing protein [Thalassobaculaceae bacterium]|nr:DUF2169 domain-containing protein [Thalassobaculaceae bacterium]